MTKHKPGRPPRFEKPMIQIGIWVTQDMLDWLKTKPIPTSEYIRNLIALDKGALE